MKNATCKSLELKVSAHVDGEISPAEREEVESHLARCESCAEAASGFRELRRLAGGQAIEPVAPAEWALLRERIHGRIGSASRRFGILQGRTFRRLALAAAAAAVLIAGAWIFLADREPPLENFAEWRFGPPPAQIEVDGETLYIKYDF